MRSATVSLLVFAGGFAAAWATWTRPEPDGQAGGVRLFSAERPGWAIVVPATPSAAELRAAKLLSETLAAAAGRTAFPIVYEGTRPPSGAIFLGETQVNRASEWGPRGVPPFDDVFALRVEAGAVRLRSARPEAIELAAGWFLERELGAHWFMPGRLGVFVPRRTELRLAPQEIEHRPAFVSRDFNLKGTTELRTWSAANGLEGRLEHGHSYERIFRPDDFAREPQMLPILDGRRVQAKDIRGQDWQPDLTARATADHAADFINRSFAAEPARIAYPLCENDTNRFDESPATLALVSPRHFFRGRPDYTPLVFRFSNAVAEAVRVSHPDRWVTAYAYSWCENAPDFPLAPTLVPFLTADRSQWFDPDFAAEDRALIARWRRAGPGILAVYDYLYGAPFLVPRPTLYAVSASIPYEYGAGVRAFFGECDPNWGLDGPKLWLAAQLLRQPGRSATELLDTYYREFWQEAAEPMRAFFALGEEAWRDQPRPGYWLKYYNDEHEALLYPAGRRERMRSSLTTAAGAARQAIVQERVSLVSRAFGVTEAFAAYCEARDELGRRTGDPAARATELARLIGEVATRRADFQQKYAAVLKVDPLAIAESGLRFVMRSDPTGQATLQLSHSATGRALLRDMKLTPLTVGGTELLADPQGQTIAIGDVGGSVSFEWAGSSQVGQWRGNGDPSERRAIAAKSENGAKVLRFTGCKDDLLSQFVPAKEGQRYVGRAQVKAVVSPGNATFVLVSFMDAGFRLLGTPQTFRLPTGRTEGWREVAVVSTAPVGTRFAGYGVHVLNQVNADEVEVTGCSLRTAEEIKN